MPRSVPGLLSLMLLLNGCASAAVGPAGPRFRSPEELIVLPPENLAPVAIRPAWPRYPVGERGRGEGATLVAAFVVDTSGMVEYRTVSFVESAASAFVRSVCEALRHTQFAPTRIDDRPRRTLVLAPFTFEVTPALPPALPPRVGPLREELRRLPIGELVARLEGAAHCS
jgi:hypothetical protein